MYIYKQVACVSLFFMSIYQFTCAHMESLLLHCMCEWNLMIKLSIPYKEKESE